MDIKKKSQIVLTIALFCSAIVNWLDIYPSFIAIIGKNQPFGFVLFICVGFLVSYFAFFIWPNMSSPLYIGLSLLLIVFFNLFFIVTKYSSYAPLGILVMLVSLVGILFTNRKIRNEKRQRN